MARPVPFLPKDGQSMTLDDLADFVQEMLGQRQMPGTTPVRAMGVVEFDFTNGPRIARLTACPED